MTRRLRKFASKLIMVLLGLVVAFLLIEVALRLNPKTQVLTWPFFIPDDDLGWVLRPDMAEDDIIFGWQGRAVSLRTNALGYRDAPEPDAIPPDAFVIAVQGDSQVAGYGLEAEETLPALLEAILRARFPADEIVVLNAGVSGYDPNQYYTQALRLIDQYPLDVLVMAFNLSNDVATSALVNSYYVPRPYWTRDEDGALTLVRPEHRAGRGMMFVDEFIPAYAAYNGELGVAAYENTLVQLNNVLYHSALYLELRDLLFPSQRGQTPVDLRGRPVMSPYNGVWQYAETVPEPYATQYGVVADLLAAWDALPPESLVVLLPELTQVSPAHQAVARDLLAESGLGAPGFDLPTARITALLEALDIPLVDPLAALREADAAMYIPGEAHFTADANRLVAGMVADALAPLLEGADDR